MTPKSVQQRLAKGIAHHRAGRLSEAAACFDRARAAAPRLFETNYLSGVVALQLGKYDVAEPLLAKAVGINPKSAPGVQAHGAVLARLGRFEEAETVARQALSLQPNLAEGWDNLGYILKARGDLAGSIQSHRRAVEVKPDYALGWHNLGLALLHTGEPAEALACQDRALSLEPQLAKAHYGRALALQNCHRLAEAVAAYDRVLAAEPNHLPAYSYRLMALNYLPEWSSAALHREHEAYGKLVAADEPASFSTVPETGRPLRVAFLSPDLRTHSVAYFLEPLIACLDPRRISLLLYHDHFTEDETTVRLRGHAKVWRNFVGLPDKEVESTVREDAPDILIDLAGHTGMNRLALLARRLAPVQVNYLGYPNTTGLEAMDYRFVDATTDPEGEADEVHTETLVRFSSTAWSYAPPVEAPPPLAPPSSAAGAPFTFGSFNNPAKISTPLLAAWARVLQAVPNSRLRLKGTGLDQEAYAAPLRQQMSRAGIDPGRVDMFDRTADLAGHLAQYHEVDVALDAFPYHGTTTTCEALWMGVPVVTLAGDRHASRVGASLLGAAGHPEWVARDWDDYVAIATDLAGQPEKLAQHRASLRGELSQSVLLDHAGQAARFGEALEGCWREYCDRSNAASLAP
jgi:predicted O-linked N-acetylglucosamine transferase (SPINDLY family)